MNAELLEFLVGKKTPAKQNEEDTASTPFKNNSNSSPRKSRKSSVSSSFSKVLVLQWLDADDTAEQVLRSIVNLQDRISQELIVTERLQQGYTQYQQEPWKAFGFEQQQQQQTGLTFEDINMTLDRDLMQHEAMLSQLRHYLSSMAQAQDAMGRRLSEWYSDIIHAVDDVERANALYVMCAKELYRKQVMVQRICEDAAEDIGKRPHRSTTTARTCLDTWRRSSQDSYLFTKLNEIEQLEKSYKS